MAKALQPNLIGMRVQGDLGDVTMYTDRWGRVIVYPLTIPKDPPSYGRDQMRARFAFAQRCYACLSADEKAALELAAQRCSLVMTGQNLWISCALRRNPTLYNTIQSQSGVTLPPLKVAT